MPGIRLPAVLLSVLLYTKMQHSVFSLGPHHDRLHVASSTCPPSGGSGKAPAALRPASSSNGDGDSSSNSSGSSCLCLQLTFQNAETERQTERKLPLQHEPFFSLESLEAGATTAVAELKLLLLLAASSHYTAKNRNSRYLNTSLSSNYKYLYLIPGIVVAAAEVRSSTEPRCLKRARKRSKFTLLTERPELGCFMVERGRPLGQQSVRKSSHNVTKALCGVSMTMTDQSSLWCIVRAYGGTGSSIYWLSSFNKGSGIKFWFNYFVSSLLSRRREATTASHVYTAAQRVPQQQVNIGTGVAVKQFRSHYVVSHNY